MQLYKKTLSTDFVHFCNYGTEILHTYDFTTVWKLLTTPGPNLIHEACLIIIYTSQNETGFGVQPGTFGLVDQCSNWPITKLIQLHQYTA